MNKLYFFVNWEKNKPQTWSGTCWGLYNSLKKYFEIAEIDLGSNYSILEKILYKLGIKKRDMDYSSILNHRKYYIPQLLKEQKSPILVFQFKEYIPAIKNIKSFIFQDLTVSYVEYMSKNLPTTFKVSGFNIFDQQTIKKKLALEEEYQRNCTAIFCMGEWLRQDCINRLGLDSNQVYAVGGGININVNNINNDIKKECNKVLFIGRDFKRKGGFLVYEAFCKLKKEKPDAELYVAGPKINPISHPINGYYFLGDCNHETLSSYFNLCDIFCMPSYFEAYGLVFIEALTYGLPCIGRNCYEMPYFIQDGETGYLIDQDDPEKLASMMFHLLSDDRIKNNVLSKRAWYLKNYTWEAVAKRINDIIKTYNDTNLLS